VGQGLENQDPFKSIGDVTATMIPSLNMKSNANQTSRWICADGLTKANKTV
jgi:hypothetical protein